MIVKILIFNPFKFFYKKTINLLHGAAQLDARLRVLRDGHDGVVLVEQEPAVATGLKQRRQAKLKCENKAAPVVVVRLRALVRGCAPPATQETRVQSQTC